jgi:hypothetical protein
MVEEEGGDGYETDFQKNPAEHDTPGLARTSHNRKKGSPRLSGFMNGGHLVW